MRLFTQEQFERLCDNGKPGHHGNDWQPVVKLILPGSGCVWLLSEIVHSNYKLYGYGLSDYGYGGVQAGYIDLGLLEIMSDPLQSHHVRRDKDFIAQYGMSVYQTAARMNGCIVDDGEALSEALAFLMPAEQPMNQRILKVPNPHL